MAAGDASDPTERKERVLHTRVPESLERHLKQRARGLGLSVSTVVRNVLLNTFGLVEDIVADGTNIALALAGEETVPARRHARARVGAGDGAVLGWQEAVLALNAVCDGCNAVLAKGARAAIGVRDRPAPGVFLCLDCLEGVATGPGAAEGGR